MTEEYPKTYKIEKGIPMPDRKYGRSGAFKQLRDHMEVGDSVVVDSVVVVPSPQLTSYLLAPPEP
mgnify:CR=1 FL=1